MAKFFPFSERSGLNVVSEFNLDNMTVYGVKDDDLAINPSDGDQDQHQLEEMEIEDMWETILSSILFVYIFHWFN